MSEVHRSSTTIRSLRDLIENGTLYGANVGRRNKSVLGQSHENIISLVKYYSVVSILLYHTTQK